MSSAHRVLVRLSLTIAMLGTGACAGGGSGDGAASTTTASGTAVSGLTVPSTTVSPAPVSQPAPFTGYVQQIYSTGDFVLVSGPVTYTVVMSPTTSVINIRGRRVPRQFIAVAGSVEVTGTLDASTITAQTVLVPTRKDDP